MGIEKIKNRLSDKEILYFLLTRLKHEDARELSILLDLDVLIRLVTVYGGKMIRIPDKDEMSDALNDLLAYYYKNYNNMGWSDVVESVTGKRTYGTSLKSRVNSAENDLKTSGFKKLRRFLEMLKKDVLE